MSRWMLACLLWLPLLALAAPRAWLDRDSIRMGETVTLNVETDARGGSEPDFGVLDANFRRLGSSSNTQLSFVNGRQTAHTLWAVALEPRQEGVIGIPALQVGDEVTAPLSLTVLPMPSGGSAAKGDDVFLEVEAEPSNPYVQQQVRYTVRLYFAVTLLEGQLEEPQTAGAQMRRLGQDVQYQKTLSDRRYTVVERHYALVPEASGALEVPGPQFRGRALRTGGYGSLLSPNANLAARGNAVSLQVRPRPANAPANWLPAQSLTLTDESGDKSSALQVGEPLTLTLRVSAQGLAAEQLPELALPAIEGAEVYPDQETSQTRDDGQWLRGERVRKFAIVPTRPGALVIPEVAIAWWNTGTDQAQRTVLPARTWSVAPGAGASAAAPDLRTQETPAEPATVAPAPVAAPTGWWPLATALFAALWLASLWMLRRRRLAAATAPDPRAAENTAPRNGGDWRRAWRDVMERRDPAAAAQRLLEAARTHDARCRNLDDIALRLDDPAQRDALQRLEQALYRGAEDPALFDTLRVAFERGPRWRSQASVVASLRDELPDLYPPRD
jgi:hypothetical protein